MYVPNCIHTARNIMYYYVLCTLCTAAEQVCNLEAAQVYLNDVYAITLFGLNHECITVLTKSMVLSGTCQRGKHRKYIAMTPERNNV